MAEMSPEGRKNRREKEIKNNDVGGTTKQGGF
jgi:hypothetical protein